MCRPIHLLPWPRLGWADCYYTFHFTQLHWAEQGIKPEEQTIFLHYTSIRLFYNIQNVFSKESIVKTHLDCVYGCTEFWVGAVRYLAPSIATPLPCTVWDELQ